MKVIIIAPHHDDEVIGCGGSICLHKQRGDQVVVVFVFAGWSAIPSVNDKEKASQIIQKEAKIAGDILGVDETKELNLPDRSFIVGKEALHKLIRVLRNVRGCNILYIPHENEGDREHKITSDLAHEAIWLASSDYLPDLGKKIFSPDIVLGYEVWSPLSRYQLAVDITLVVSRKKRAIEAYQTQLQIKNWADACIGLNAYRGVTTGKGNFVEVFQVQKINSGFMNGGIP